MIANNEPSLKASSIIGPTHEHRQAWLNNTLVYYFKYKVAHTLEGVVGPLSRSWSPHPVDCSFTKLLCWFTLLRLEDWANVHVRVTIMTGFYYKLHQFIVELPHFIQPSGPIIDRGVLHDFQVTLLGICNFVTPSPLGWAAGHCCFDWSAPQSDCSNHMRACLLTTFNRDLVSLVGFAHWSD